MAMVGLDYEAHITLDPSSSIDDDLDGWHFSQIRHDPVLGKRDWKYLTKHSDDADALLEQMMALAGGLPDVVRTKVEHVIFDRRWGIPSTHADE